ncbi:MAG: formylglycine-generating enzyme family protein [Treponema sp.]|nr:formylglycine-generating enzyme family protein [Treponema sp.]
MKSLTEMSKEELEELTLDMYKTKRTNSKESYNKLIEDIDSHEFSIKIAIDEPNKKRTIIGFAIIIFSILAAIPAFILGLNLFADFKFGGHLDYIWGGFLLASIVITIGFYFASVIFVSENGRKFITKTAFINSIPITILPFSFVVLNVLLLFKGLLLVDFISAVVVLVIGIIIILKEKIHIDNPDEYHDEKHLLEHDTIYVMGGKVDITSLVEIEKQSVKSVLFTNNRFINNGAIYVKDLLVAKNPYSYGDFLKGKKNSHYDNKLLLEQKYLIYTVHPEYMVMHNICWYEAIIFCNQLSQSEGKKAVYYIENVPGVKVYDPISWKNTPNSNIGGDKSELYYNSQQNSPVLDKIQMDEQADGWRLPTMDEWEYIARGGINGTFENYIYSGSNTNISDFDSEEALPGLIGINTTKNELGIENMSGLVYEWCFDTYEDKRVVRGGSWKSDIEDCTIASLNLEAPFEKREDIGFRIVRNCNYFENDEKNEEDN